MAKMIKERWLLKNNSCSKLLYCVVQGKLDCTVVPNSTKLRPCSSFATEHGLTHVFWCRIGQHAREVGVRDLWENGDIPRVFLADHRRNLLERVGITPISAKVVMR